MSKNILVIDGHPREGSFGAALAARYVTGAIATGNAVRLLALRDLVFDPNFTKQPELEPDLQRAQQYITEAEHVVWVFPIWWGMPPALVKGFLDRVLTPGFAYKYRSVWLWPWPQLVPIRLLKGRSARVITTQDSPWYVMDVALLSPIGWALHWAVFWYVGFYPVSRTIHTRALFRTDTEREGWLQHAEQLGRRAR
jgi:putative NADPH-quinone reductase